MYAIISYNKSLRQFQPMMNFRTIPLATVSLIALNVLVFVFGFLTNSHTWIIANFGFVPDSIFDRNSLDRFQETYSFQSDQQTFENGAISTFIRLLSSMFIHASLPHIVFNLAALAYIGGYTERSIGIGRYIVIYFLSGICAALFHGVIASYVLDSGQTLLIGASGAISGVLGIAAALGNRRAYYWLVIQIVFAFVGSVTLIPIAFTAHVGGFLAGVILTKLLVKGELLQRREPHRVDEGGTY
jgi:membrane associated rhomboid family serine protease